MVRNYKRKSGARRYLDYGVDQMQQAIDAVNNGMSIHKASNTFEVCRSTLTNRIQGKHQLHAGDQTIMEVEEENEIEGKVLLCADFGFPISMMDLRFIVKSYLDMQGRTVLQFANNLPGRDWSCRFLKRHKNITRRTCNNIKRARAQVSEATLTEYHENLTNELQNIPPQNIFNFDETNLADNTSSQKMLFRRGVKYPDNVANFTKSCVTVMFCASATGVLLPPFVVYKRDTLYTTWTQRGPKAAPCCEDICCSEGCQFGNTSSGWFNLQTFEKWFQESFLPHAKRLNGPKALVGDNLSCHFSANVLQLCEEHNIRFICLPPNATHLAQPLDVSFFTPLKGVWKTLILEFKNRNPGKKIVDKCIFPQMLSKLLNHETSKNKVASNLKAGFKGTGIYPLNVEALKKRLTGNKSQALLQSPRLVHTGIMDGDDFLDDVDLENPGTSASPSQRPSTPRSVTSSPALESALTSFLREKRFGGDAAPARGRESGKRIVPGKRVTTSTFDEDTPQPTTTSKKPKNGAQTQGRGSEKGIASTSTTSKKRKRATSPVSSSTDEDDLEVLRTELTPTKHSQRQVSYIHKSPSKKVVSKVSAQPVPNFLDLVLVKVEAHGKINTHRTFLAEVRAVEEIEGKKEFHVEFFRAASEAKTTFSRREGDKSAIIKDDIVAIVNKQFSQNSRGQYVFAEPLDVTE